MPVGRDSARRRTFSLLSTAAIAGVLLFYFHDKFWYPPDEGNYAHVAERILEGEALHHDIQDIHFGYINYLNAGAFRLFGTDLLSLRYALVAVALTAALIISGLLVHSGVLVSMAGGVGSIALGLLLFLNPSANWFALFFTVFLVGYLKWMPGGRMGILVLGILLGLVAAFRQLTGGIVGIGLVTWLLISSGTERPSTGRESEGVLLPWALWLLCLAVLTLYAFRSSGLTAFLLFGVWPVLIHLAAGREIRISNRDTIEILGLLGAGILLSLTPMLAVQVAAGGLQPWWNDVVKSALDLSEFQFPTSYSWSTWLVAATGGSLLVGFPGPLIGAVLLMMMLSVALLGGELLVRLRRGESLQTHGPLPFLAVYFGLVPVHFPSLVYLAFAFPFVLLGHLSLPRARLRALVTLAAIPVAVFWLAAQPTERSLRQFLAGERVPWVGSEDLGRSGLLVSPLTLSEVGLLVTRIEQETSPDEPIFAFPSRAEFYFLSERRNPTRFFNTALGIRSPAAVAELIRRFEEVPPAAVVYDGNDKYRTAESDLILRWVEREYSMADSAGGVILFLPLPGDE
jgi:hypothetical protein